MSVGFRKSLFGFNCDDVINYVEETHRSFSEKESELNKKIDTLDSTLTEVNAQLNEVIAAKSEVEAKLKEYTDKYDEIERLSQNIGKLYLVAQANSKSIMKNSADNKDMIEREVKKNISSINYAHNSLDELKANITRTSSEFVAKVDALTASLNSVREQIAVKNAENKKLEDSFENMFAGMTK